jgi:arylsulfatase A-like enzyme
MILLFVSYFLFGQNNSPNILIIQADDMGFNDLSLHRNPHLETTKHLNFIQYENSITRNINMLLQFNF